MTRDNSTFDKQIRRIYEPRYGRRLSDEEVTEIRRNLDAFAKGLLAAAKDIHSRENASSSTER
jgi:accessory colonization factor AcfC